MPDGATARDRRQKEGKGQQGQEADARPAASVRHGFSVRAPVCRARVGGRDGLGWSRALHGPRGVSAVLECPASPLRTDRSNVRSRRCRRVRRCTSQSGRPRHPADEALGRCELRLEPFADGPARASSPGPQRVRGRHHDPHDHVDVRSLRHGSRASNRIDHSRQPTVPQGDREQAPDVAVGPRRHVSGAQGRR